MSDQKHEEQHDFFGDDTHGNDLSSAQVASIDDHRWPKTMSEFVEVLSAAAVRQGISKDKTAANEIARWAVLTLGVHFGGRQVYLPKGDVLHTALRDMQMWQEFTGHNHEQLASKYKLSVVAVYKIIGQQRALHMAKVQPRLPLEEMLK